LLPNLLDLSFRGKFEPDEGIMIWLSVFTPPSLQTLDLRLGKDPNTLSLSNASSIMALLVQKCPKLQNLTHALSLTPSQDSKNDPHESAMSQIALLPMICRHLLGLHHLSCLAIRGSFINSESLVAISQLPHLATLRIRQISDRNKDLPRILKTTQLPDKSFLALRDLRLQSFVLEDLLAVWDQVQLVRGLTYASLRCEPHVGQEGDSIFQDVAARALLPLICKRSPRIGHILMRGGPMNEPLSIDAINSAWADMACLPLHSIDLHNFECDELFMRGVPHIWPGLTNLSMPNHWLSLEDLAHLSRLPKLQNLSANLADLTEPIPDLQSHAGSSLREIDIAKPLIKTLEVESAKNVAK
jgi:hypothetical protein